jgi:hypothetical protein
VSSGEQAIAFQIEINALEEVVQVEQSITATLEHCDFVVEAFHKAAARARLVTL